MAPDGVSDVIGAIMLPALENTARAQAQAAFQGMYQSSDPAVNSSLTIVADDGLPGMPITSWISNGTDFFGTIASLSGQSILDLSLRVYPTNVGAVTASEGSRIAFRIIPENKRAHYSSVSNLGIFTTGCETWFAVVEANYGGLGLDEVVFNKGVGENVESVEVPSLRITMIKEV